MSFLAFALALLVPAPQEEPAEWIKLLRSDRIEEREEAARKLADLGKAARPGLRELQKDADRELAARAASILGEIDNRERAALLRLPARKSSTSLRNLTFEDAALKVFGPFGVTARVQSERDDLGIATISLKFEDLGFWDAVDCFSEAGKVSHNAINLSGAPMTPGLVFQTSSLPVAWDTVGDLRVFSMVLGGNNDAEHLAPRFWVACPSWAAPKRIRIERLKLVSWPNSRELGAQEGKAEPLPQVAGRLTVATLPAAIDLVPRDSLKELKTIDVEGKLRITRGDAKGDDDTLVPFTIRSLKLPADRRR